MSNEKLGAEQGREFDFEAIGDAIDRVLAGQRELTPAEQKNLRGIYSKLFTKLKPEQAYHARGAGALIAPIEALIEYHEKYAKGHVSSKWIYGENMMVVQAYKKVLQMIEAQREPGADTGTTPSRDCVWTVEQNGAVHSVHSTYESAFKEEGENLRIGGPWQVLPWRTAERGTTPPEGLAFTFEEFIDMSLRHNKRLAAGISGIASFGHWYNEMLAATQRAPVEQGRDELQELKLSSEGGRSGSSHPVTLLSSPSPASADHAQEGTLRAALDKLKYAPLSNYTSREYEYSTQADMTVAMSMGRDLANGIFNALERVLEEGE